MQHRDSRRNFFQPCDRLRSFSSLVILHFLWGCLRITWVFHWEWIKALTSWFLEKNSEWSILPFVICLTQTGLFPHTGSHHFCWLLANIDTVIDALKQWQWHGTNSVKLHSYNLPLLESWYIKGTAQKQLRCWAWLLLVSFATTVNAQEI